LINIYNFENLNSFNSFSTIELIIISSFLLALGSFSSSLIFRLSPSFHKFKKNILFSRSFCPTCKSNLSPLELIPMLSYLFQFAKCRSCKSKIPIHYFLGESLFLIVGLWVLFTYGKTIFSLIIITIFFIFLILLVLDYKYFYLPFSLNISLIFIGFSSNYFYFAFVDDNYLLVFGTPLMFSLYGFIFGYTSLWLINFIYKNFSNKDGIGGGDFILFAGLGSLFGPFSLSIILLFASIIGFALYFLQKGNSNKQIPLGSCLIISSFLYIFIKKNELLKNILVI
tara:strand:- start:10 stop:858 length:849 start_codon:yes stop_codon:yes gene_type:complete